MLWTDRVPSARNHATNNSASTTEKNAVDTA
jgi:hypothetical protein